MCLCPVKINFKNPFIIKEYIVNHELYIVDYWTNTLNFSITRIKILIHISAIIIALI